MKITIIPSILEIASANPSEQDKKRANKTIKALEFVQEELSRSDAETVLVIAPSESHSATSFSILEVNKIKNERIKVETSLELIESIKKRCARERIPLMPYNTSSVSYRVAIPIQIVKEALPKANFVVVETSVLSSAEHLEFGKVLSSAIDDSGKKVALVVSANLSKKLSPGTVGYSLKARLLIKTLSLS